MTRSAAIALSAVFAAASSADEGPDVVVVAASANPHPGRWPDLRVVREKLWGKYYPLVSMTFPDVPDFTCDAWCYESEVDFLDARPTDGGRLEMRHRDRRHPQLLVITTITPRPGSVLFEARVDLDRQGQLEASLPDAPPGLNLCWQLRHAPGFASKPDPYPAFVRRCFLFTERGRTFLHDTQRMPIPVQRPDHKHNNPPWVQTYISAARPVPQTSASAWAGCSPDRYLTPVIGVVSRDGRHLAAIANDSADLMAQAWHDCLHNNPRWLPEDAPIRERRWRLAVYALENSPKALLDRVASDFPRERGLAALAAAPASPKGWKSFATRAGWVELPDGVEWKKSLPLGPFVRLGDGRILGVSESEALVSGDDGGTWAASPLFSSGQRMKVRGERALARTAGGTVVLVFLNEAKRVWRWDPAKRLPNPGARLPVWSIRSLDNGRTWVDAQEIYDGYCGDIHHMLVTREGRIVVPVQELLPEDGRHALRPRWSADEGRTWCRSNLLDIGGRGHHDGLMEATLAERRDGRLWMLCRTNLGRFWSAYSDDGGRWWRTLEPSDIAASSAPGTFHRLAGGRLMLVWNRLTPEGTTEVPPEAWKDDGRWSEARAANYRAELSIAFSSDDGRTWSRPSVIARRRDAPGASLAYAYVFEPRPGEIWITTMQGDLRLSLREADFAPQAAGRAK